MKISKINNKHEEEWKKNNKTILQTQVTNKTKGTTYNHEYKQNLQLTKKKKIIS